MVGAGAPLPGLLLAALSALLTLAWHQRFFTADGSLPVGDSGGHLMNCIRALDWLRGGPFVAQAFPPGVYVPAAAVSFRWGASLDHMTLGVALYGGLLAASLSWLGWRVVGLSAALLLPLLALSAPMLSGMSRLILLDLPATACIVTVWVLVWESRLFRARLPTLLLGLALGLAALVKYTFAIWVLPWLLVAGGIMLLRAPTALIPLLLLGPPLRVVGLALLARADMPSGSSPIPGELRYLLLILGQGLLLQAGALVVARFLPGRRETWWRQGLFDGAWLGIAALIAITVFLPWFHLALPEVWIKVKHEAIDEVRTSGMANGVRFAETMLMGSWAGGWWALIVAAWIELLALLHRLLPPAWSRLRRWEPLRRRWPPIDPPVASPVFRLGPAIPVGISCFLGSWLTIRSLPVDPRYFLPLIGGAAVVLGIGACRLRLGRWTLGLAVATSCFLSLWAAECGAPVNPVRLSMEAYNPAVASRAGPWGFFVPPAARSSTLLLGAEGLMGEVVRRSPRGEARRILLVLPSFGEGRSVGLEDRSLVGLAALLGLNEHAVATWSVEPSRNGPPLLPEARLAGASWLAVAGLRLSEGAVVLQPLADRLGEVAFQADTDDRMLRLYPLSSLRIADPAELSPEGGGAPAPVGLRQPE